MSYRHSSYRKLKQAAKRMGVGGLPLRSDVKRLSHWSGIGRPGKPEGWGVPRKKRAA